MSVGATRAARGRTTCTTGTTRTRSIAAGTAGTIGEGGLEDALQFGGLVAGQLARGDLAADEVVDLGLDVAGLAAAGLVAGAAGLDLGIDVGQRRRQCALVVRGDRAGGDLGLQLILQLLQGRLIGAGRGRRDRGHDSSREEGSYWTPRP